MALKFVGTYINKNVDLNFVIYNRAPNSAKKDRNTLKSQKLMKIEKLFKFIYNTLLHTRTCLWKAV